MPVILFGFSKEYFSLRAILSAFPLDATKSFLEEETLGIEFPERESNPKVISKTQNLDPIVQSNGAFFIFKKKTFMK